jgi:sugar/nucleoside kinase (ribokinase family)
MTGVLQHGSVRPARYLAVGHVTVDVLETGERRPGGTVLYSALQAARLGLAATVLTRGRPDELAELLGSLAGEVELVVQPAPETTTLATTGAGAQRRQRLLAWAGPIELDALPQAELLHLAPVAAELAGEITGEWGFVGLTPQGLARRWMGPGEPIEAGIADPAAVASAGRCDAVVLSEQEQVGCEALIAQALAGGATVAVTAGPGATTLLLAGGERREMAVEPVEAPVDDLGAGDVYAAAFFVSLAEGEQAPAAARLASIAAALRMHGVGPQAIAHRTAIQERASALSPPGR